MAGSADTPHLKLENGAPDPYVEKLDAEAGAVDRAALVVRNDLEIENLPPIAWLVDHVFPKGGLSVIYGAPGSAKSFVALDLAFSVAAGVQWLGRTVLAGGALYIAAEGMGGLGQRVRAWKADRGFAGQQLGVGFITNAVDLLDVVNSARIIQATEHVRSPIRLVVIDTLARSMVGDENDTRDMGRFVAACDRIREATGAHVAVLHHSRKDSDVERGNTQLRGAVDTLILCVEEDDGRQLRCEKQKDSEAFEPISFRLVPGHGSCVVGGLGVRSSADRDDVVSEWTPKRMKALRELAAAGSGLSATDWQEVSGISRRSFFRVRAWLSEHGFVQEKGHRYSVTVSGRSAISANGANKVPNASANGGSSPPKGGTTVAPGAGLVPQAIGTNPNLFDDPPSDSDYADQLAAEVDERLGMREDV